MTTGDSILKVRFVSESKYGFEKGRIYEAIEGKGTFGGVKMLCIKDISGEEYAYPASWFEILD
ncbi:MAG: hypothetical protein IJU41_03590 [Clostridia bacterium]|nr:hypothetical protein [Clostridia bacterium]